MSSEEEQDGGLALPPDDLSDYFDDERCSLTPQLTQHSLGCRTPRVRAYDLSALQRSLNQNNERITVWCTVVGRS